MAVKIVDGEIVWISHSITPSKIPDINVLRQERFAAVITNRDPDNLEFYFTDLGFYGDFLAITAEKKPEGGDRSELEKVKKFLIDSLKVVVEQVNNRILVFGCLKHRGKWRHSIEKHEQCFTVICHSVNVWMKYEPVRKERHPLL